MVKESYHHGDLRRTLLEAAAKAIGEEGPAALSLRALARRAGVSHAAPTHHFGDKAGLLTALAVEGYDLLANELTEEWSTSHSFLEQGVAYVRFALNHRAHFEVMFRPDLYHATDPDVIAARDRASRALYTGIADRPTTGAPAPPADPSAPASPAAADPDSSASPAVADPDASAPPAVVDPDASASSNDRAIPDPSASSTDRAISELRAAGLAAWSIAHGFATLRVSGAFPDLPGDPDEIARAVLGRLPPPGKSS